MYTHSGSKDLNLIFRLSPPRSINANARIRMQEKEMNALVDSPGLWA